MCGCHVDVSPQQIFESNGNSAVRWKRSVAGRTSFLDSVILRISDINMFFRISDM
jgi:hypothetical protein